MRRHIGVIPALFIACGAGAAVTAGVGGVWLAAAGTAGGGWLALATALVSGIAVSGAAAGLLARRVAHGGDDLRWDAPGAGRSEFGPLAGSANRMTGELRRMEETVAKWEKTFRSTVDDLPLLFCRFLADGTLVYVNTAYCAYFGVAREDLVGRSFFDLIPEGGRNAVREQYRSLTRKHPAKTYEHQVFAPDGSIRWQRWTDRAIFEGRKVIEYHSFGEDITGRKLAEEELRESEDKFGRAFRFNPSLLLIVDIDHDRVVEVNDTFSRVTGYSRDEIAGHPAAVLDVLLTTELREALIAEMRERRLVPGREIPFRCKSGGMRLANAFIERLGARDEGAFLITANDVTEVRRTQEALRESERRLSALVNNLPGCVYRCRADEFFTVEYISDGVRAITGYSPEDFVGNRTVSFQDILEPPEWEMIQRETAAALAEKRPYVAEYRIRTRDGSRRWVWDRGAAVYGADGEVAAIEGFFTDVTARREAEEERRESEEKFATAFRASPNSMLILDGDTRRILEVNGAFTRLTGCSPDEMIGRTTGELGIWEDEGLRAAVWETFREKGTVSGVEIGIRRRDGAVRRGLVSVDAVSLSGRRGVLAVMNDITAIHEAREALRESEEKYRVLFESMDNAVARHRIITDEHGNPVDYIYLDVNEAFVRLTGWTRADIAGMRMSEIFPELARDSFDWVGTYGRVALTGEPARFERYSPAFRRWISVSVHSPARGEFVTNFYDISEHREAEEARERYASLLRATIDSTEDGIMVTAVDRSRVTVHNARLRELWRLSAELLDNGTEEEIFREVYDQLENPDEFLQIERDYLADPAREGVDMVHFRDGRVYEQYTRPQRLGDEIVGRVWSVRDVTRRLLVEQSLRESEEKYRSLFESMNDGSAEHLLVTDENETPVDFIFLDMNREFESLMNIRREDVLGRGYFEHYEGRKDEENPEWLRRYARVALSGVPERFELYSVIAGKWFSVSAYSPSPGIFVSTIHDITARKRAEESLRESEKLLAAVLDNLPVAVWVIGPHGETIRGNPAGRRIWAGSRPLPPEGKIVPKGWYADTGEELRPEDWASGRVVREGSAVLDEEVEIECMDGTRKTLLISGIPLRNEQGTVIGAVTVNEDITARKQAVDALRKNEKLLAAVLDRLPVGVWILDREMKPIRRNIAGRLLWGGKTPLPEDVFAQAKGWRPGSGKPVREEEWAHVRAFTTGLEAVNEEIEIECMDGTRKIIRNIGIPLFDDDGAVGGVVIVNDDITGRKQAENALRESEHLLATVLERLPVGVWILSRDHNPISRNQAGRLLWGGKTELGMDEPAVTKGWWPDTGEELRPEEWASWHALEKGEAVTNEEVEIECMDGTRKVIRNIGVPLRNEAGDVTGAIIVNDEVTARKHAEDALREEKERLAVTLRSIGDGVITTDREGRVVLMNRVAEQLTGWGQEEAAGRPLEEVFRIFDTATRECCESPHRKIIATGGIVELSAETLLIARDGREIMLADSGAPILDRHSRIIGAVLVFRDVTERQRLQDELMKMEKLESIGVLAGGIAHDFNNILTGLLGSLSLAGTMVDRDGEAAELLREAEKQSLRARDLTAQLLTFSKGGLPVRITASIVETVKETTKFMLRGSRVKAVFSLPESLWAARVDLSQLTQVVNNLVLNAIQAMPDGGRIEVEAHNVVIDNPKKLPLAPGSYIALSVRDHGKGIPKDNLTRVFDPYFTTKQMGNGLGLATTYSIVKRHDGHIEVESEPGRGTAFRIYLPAVPGEKPAPARDTTEDDDIARTHHGGRKRVLVMDDDEGVRGMAALLLNTIGYSAWTANDGESALAMYRGAMEAGDPFDAVIMDLTVPGGMGGREAMEELRKYDPEVCAIVSSGYSTDPIMGEYREYGFRGVLMKPYRLEEIARVLRDVLGGGGNNGK